MFEGISIKGGDDCFRLYGHLMDRSISEINYLFGMAERKAGIPTAAFVSGIGRSGGIAPSKRFPYSGIRDLSRPTAIAEAHELAVPSRCGHPQFEFDVGILGGLDFCGDAAKRRQVVH